MTNFEKKVQNEIARVKGLKGGHTSGLVKVPAGTEDKLYLDYPIIRLKNVVLQRHVNCMSWMLDQLRIYFIMKTKTISKSN